MMSGFTSSKACATTLGEGKRVRKWTCVPHINSYNSSKDMEYICAIGNIHIELECSSRLVITLEAKLRLPIMAR